MTADRPSAAILVVAAWEPELERFRALARDRLGSDVAAEAIGIGLVDATVGVTRSVFHHAPRRVVLVGTCGAAPTSGLRVGDVIVGTGVRLVDPVVVEGRAAMPYASEAVALDEAMIDAAFSAGAREASIVNTLGITTDDALAMKLAPLGQVEHLEAYGVARACHAERVGCSVILGVANIVGAGGREAWRANHATASARAAEIAWGAIGALRPSRAPR